MTPRGSELVTGAQGAPPGAIAGARRWIVLSVLCVTLLLISLDTTVLNVAMPTIVRRLRATSSQLQWTVDAYAVVFAGLLLVLGSLGDRIGRKWVFLGGLVVFAAGSAGMSTMTSAVCIGPPSAFLGSMRLVSPQWSSRFEVARVEGHAPPSRTGCIARPGVWRLPTQQSGILVAVRQHNRRTATFDSFTSLHPVQSRMSSR